MNLGIGLGLGLGITRATRRGVPAWVLPGASLDLDFVNSRYYGTALDQLSCSRASTGYAMTAAGVLVPFAANTLRITDQGLLVEEARTNLLRSSNEFSNTYWGYQRVTVATNAAVAPDGTTTASAFVEDNNNGAHGVYAISISKDANALNYTLTAYLKAGTRTWAQMAISLPNESLGRRVYFNLTGAGSVGTNHAIGDPAWPLVSTSIKALTNGWYRASMTVTSNTDTAIGGMIRSAPNTGENAFVGNSDVGIYAWGAQLEQSSFPTSYIPTTTAAASRAADNVSMAFNAVAPFSLFGQGFPTGVVAALGSMVQLDTGTESNTILLYKRGADGGKGFFLYSNSATQADLTSGGNFVLGQSSKLAGAANTNDVAFSGSGATVGTDNIATMPVGLNTLRIGSGVNVNYWNGYIQRAAYFPMRLPDATLRSLTA